MPKFSFSNLFAWLCTSYKPSIFRPKKRISLFYYFEKHVDLITWLWAPKTHILFNILNWSVQCGRHAVANDVQNFPNTVSRNMAQQTSNISPPSPPVRPKFVLCCREVHITSLMLIIKLDWHVDSGYSPTTPQLSITDPTGKNCRKNCPVLNGLRNIWKHHFTEFRSHFTVMRRAMLFPINKTLVFNSGVTLIYSCSLS